MSMLTVVLHLLQLIDRERSLVVRSRTWLALHDHVPAEFTGEHNQCSVEQSSFVQVSNQLRNRLVDGFLHTYQSFVAVGVSVPIEKRNVLRGHFYESSSSLNETSG